jgi:predicted Zn-dependent protease
MLDDAIEAGYAARDAKRWDEALETWLEAWDVVWSRLPRDARALDGARPAFEDTAYLREWLDDLLDELWLAGHDDPAPALRGLRLLEDLLARFPDEPEVARTVWRANRASFLVAVGREEEGKRILREIVREHPERSVGWLSLADALVLVGERDPATLAEAADLLATARARVADAKEWRLEERYREVLKLLRRAQSGA